jgi:hypothetical protein
MLDAFVIEEIKRRERDRSREERPAIEVPRPPLEPPPADRGTPPESPDRGVVIIDYG